MHGVEQLSQTWLKSVNYITWDIAIWTFEFQSFGFGGQKLRHTGPLIRSNLWYHTYTGKANLGQI